MRHISNLTINLTHDCNMRCSYCFNNGHSRATMPPRIAKKCIDLVLTNARDFLSKTVEICFWGGEPLIEWQLMKDLVKYTEKRRPFGVKVSFGGTTNGTLLTEDKAKFMCDHSVWMLISLDGTQATHDRHRKMTGGAGSHALIMRNMETVLKRIPAQKVRISPYPARIGHFFEDVQYLVENGIYNLMYSPVYEHPWQDRHWQLWESECDRVSDLIASYKAQGTIIEIEHFRRFAEGQKSPYPCGAGRHYMHFDCDGSAWPCHRFNKMDDHRHWREKAACVGHIDYGITNPRARNLFVGPRITACTGCPDFGLCSSGCYAINYDLMGDIFRPPEKICRYVSMQKRVSLHYQQKVYPRGMPIAIQENPFPSANPCGMCMEPGNSPSLELAGMVNLLARKVTDLERICA